MQAKLKLLVCFIILSDTEIKVETYKENSMQQQQQIAAAVLLQVLFYLQSSRLPWDQLGTDLD